MSPLVRSRASLHQQPCTDRFSLSSSGDKVRFFFVDLAFSDHRAVGEQLDLLFIIERSTNLNVVHYIAYLTDKGTFNAKEPVAAYWIMAAEDGHREELSWFQRKQIYGFYVHPGATGKSLNLSIRALERVAIRVAISGNIAQAETEIDGHAAFLKRAYVQMSNGLLPSVDFIKLSGYDSTNGKELNERLNSIPSPTL